MSLSYEYSIGSVRARETSLFTPSDIEQLLSCRNLTELCTMLKNKGYADGNSFDEIIENHARSVWEYLENISPDTDIFAPFIYINDIHNLKAILKGIIADREYSNLLITPCTIDENTLKKAVQNRDFRYLPDWLSESADKAYDILAHTGDAGMSDAFIDKAVMERLIYSSKKYHSFFLKKYFNTFVFYNNIKIALRSSRTGTSRDYLQNALCDAENFRKSAVITSALKGHNSLVDELSKYTEYDCKTAMDEYKKSPSSFEKFIDNKLMTIAKENCKTATEGIEPIIGYFLAFKAERKAIHIIASGIKTNSDRDKIRERLREIYG